MTGKLEYHIAKRMPLALQMTKDIHNAKDLLQNLALMVFKNPLYYQSKSDHELNGLLFWNMKVLYLKMLAANKKHSSFELLPYNIAVKDSVFDNIEKKELHRALLSLKNKRAGLNFRLRLDGYSYNEITTMTGSSKTTINNDIIRTIKKLAA